MNLAVAMILAVGARDHLPLESGNSWTWAQYRTNATMAPWTATVVQSSADMAWVVGLPGMEPGAWLTWSGRTLYVWNPGENAWKPWLRFGVMTGTSYTVMLGRPMWNLTRVTVSSKSARYRDPVLGRTFYNCVRFSFQSAIPDMGMVTMTFAPGYGLVHWSKRSGLTPTSGELMSAVLGGRRFGRVLHQVVDQGPDSNTALPMSTRTGPIGPGGFHFHLINDAETWEMVKRGFTQADRIPPIDWARQSLIVIHPMHVYNSNASVVIEDVQWDYASQRAMVKARLKKPAESASNAYYSPYVILVTEKVDRASWTLSE